MMAFGSPQNVKFEVHIRSHSKVFQAPRAGKETAKMMTKCDIGGGGVLS